MTTDHHYCYQIVNGCLGMIASAFGIISTFQTQLEWWIRITGGLLGIVIAAITLYKMLTKPK
jgi:putative Mn2+ efflux pump MntP